jgi:mycothiol S-conjugate amidase
MAPVIVTNCSPVSSGRGLTPVTTRVPCADYFEIRDQALIAHATQIDPASSWFACPLDAQRAAWPTEDYHLARSVVDTELPEDDLFAGVRERVSL